MIRIVLTGGIEVKVAVSAGSTADQALRELSRVISEARKDGLMIFVSGLYINPDHVIFFGEGAGGK